MEVEGKTVLITGAARGIGRSFAETLLNLGAKVCLTDVNKELGDSTIQELQATHGSDKAVFTACDVTSDEDFNKAWEYCTEKLAPVDILINNAGVGNEQNWKLTYDINIGGTTRGTLLAMEKMSLKNGGQGGAIVNVASIAGLKTLPFGPMYGASKHAIVGLSRDLGHPLHFASTGVTVQCLCPGLVNTQFLLDSTKNAFSKEVSETLKAHAGKSPVVEPDLVSQALIQLVKEKKNGAVLVVEGGKDPYYVDAPLK